MKVFNFELKVRFLRHIYPDVVEHLLKNAHWEIGSFEITNSRQESRGKYLIEGRITVTDEKPVGCHEISNTLQQILLTIWSNYELISLGIDEVN